MTTDNLEPIEDLQARGLTREEASARLAQYGPNTVREAKSRLFLAIAQKFWAPVPWMLEATIVLEIILGKRPEAVIIGVLLVFNAGLGLLQENRAQNALALLRKRYWLRLPLPQLQTLVFVTLVFTGQGTVYLVRQRQHFWKSRPRKWLLLSSAADVAVVSGLATRGILMEAIGLQLVFAVLIVSACYLAAVDLVKIRLLRKLPQG